MRKELEKIELEHGLGTKRLAVKKVVSLSKKYKFDAIHAHQFSAASSGLVASKLLGLPFVFTMQLGLGADDYLPKKGDIRPISVFLPILKKILKKSIFIILFLETFF